MIWGGGGFDFAAKIALTSVCKYCDGKLNSNSNIQSSMW